MYHHLQVGLVLHTALFSEFTRQLNICWFRPYEVSVGLQGTPNGGPMS